MGVTRPLRTVQARVVAGVAAIVLAAACGGDGEASSGAGGDGEAEAWQPERDIVITVPYEAGGGTDRLMRSLADGIEEVRPDVTVVVETRPGASGATGYTYFVQLAGDPHRLVAAETNVVTVPMITTVDFHWSDFTPVAQVTSLIGLAMAPSGAYDGLSGLTAAAQTEPTTIGLAGLSGPLAIAATLTELETNATFERVVFDSGTEVVRAVLAGDVDFGVAAPELALEHIEAGTIDPLAVFSQERLAGGVLEDIPTAIEQGTEVDFSGFRGVFAAPDITAAERQYWTDTFAEVAESEAFQAYVEQNFALTQVRLGDEFTTYLEDFEETVGPAIEQIESTG